MRVFLVKVWVPSQIHMIRLLQSFVICKDFWIILWAFLRFACPVIVNASYILRTLTKICKLLKKAISTYYTTLVSICIGPISQHIYIHSSLCQVHKWQEQGRAIDISDKLLNATLIYALPYFVITALLCSICPTL